MRRVLLEDRQLVTKRQDLRQQGRTGSKTGGYQSKKSEEKRTHRSSHHDLTNDRNLCVFRSDGVLGNHNRPKCADEPSGGTEASEGVAVANLPRRRHPSSIGLGLCSRCVRSLQPAKCSRTVAVWVPRSRKQAYQKRRSNMKSEIIEAMPSNNTTQRPHVLHPRLPTDSVH